MRYSPPQMNGEECSIELPEDQLRGLKPGQSVTLEINAKVESIEGETLNYSYDWAEVYPDDMTSKERLARETAGDEGDEEVHMAPKKKSAGKRSIPSALA